MASSISKEAFDKRQAIIDGMSAVQPTVNHPGSGPENEKNYREDNPGKLRYFDSRWIIERYRDCTQADVDRLMKIEGEYYRLRSFISEGLMTFPEIVDLPEEEFVDELVRMNDKIQVISD